MREKTIFDGHIDGTPKEIQDIIDLFLFENLGLPGIDYKVEDENQKRLYVIYSPHDAHRIINGYTEISTLSLSENTPVNVRIVSCRPELDLLFFQVSQRIQAKFIVKGFPPEVLATPWRELISQGFISPLSSSVEDVLIDKLPDPKEKMGRFGRERKLSLEQVRSIVSRCEAARGRGSTIEWFYYQLSDSYQQQFALGTLKDWMKDPKFNKTKKLPRKLPR